MKRLLQFIFCTGIFFSSVTAQTTLQYNESFNENTNPGWSFLAPDASIFFSDGKLNLTTNDDDIIIMMLPITATKDDFSFKVFASTAGGIEMGGFGRVGFNSAIQLHVEDDSIFVYYRDNLSDEAAASLAGIRAEMDIASFELKLTKSGSNAIVQAYLNTEEFCNVQLNNVDDGIFQGQMVAYIQKDPDEPLMNWSLDAVEINYNSLIDIAGTFNENFSTSNSSWFAFGDWDDIYQSISIGNNKMNFNYNGTSGTALYVIPPVGSVSDFTIEIEAGSEGEHNAPFGVSRFFDYLNYLTMFFEDDSIYIGYGSNSFEPVIIDKSPIAFTNPMKIKFSVVSSDFSQTMYAWVNDNLRLSGTVNSTGNNKLASGHLALGFDRGNFINAYFNYANISYNVFIPEEPLFLDHITNNMSLSVFSNSALGYHEGHGNSLTYLESTDLLFSGGIVFGNEQKGISGNIGSFYFSDITQYRNVQNEESGDFFDQKISAAYSDEYYANKYGVEVLQHSYSRVDKDIVFINFRLKNISSNPLNNFYIGMFADFDIVSYDQNLGGYDASKNLIYQFDPASQTHCGLIALNGLAGGKVTAEGGTRMDLLGYLSNTDYSPPAVNGDYRIFISAGPYNIPASDDVLLSFAVTAGDSYNTLIANVDEAAAIFNTNVVQVNDKVENVPDNFILYQNYPNPFNPGTIISFSLPKADYVTLKIYDILGSEIETLIHNELKEAGTHKIQYSVKNNKLSSGVHFCKLQSGQFTQTKKLLFLK